MADVAPATAAPKVAKAAKPKKAPSTKPKAAPSHPPTAAMIKAAGRYFTWIGNHIAPFVLVSTVLFKLHNIIFAFKHKINLAFNIKVVKALY